MIQVMNSGVHLHDDKIKGKQKEKLCCSMMVIDNWHKWNNKNQAHWVTQKQFYETSNFTKKYFKQIKIFHPNKQLKYIQL